MDLNKHDQQAWKDFTSSQAFSNGIIQLREESIPVVVKSASAHEMSFDAGRVSGYMQALKDLRTLGNQKMVERSADQPGLEQSPSR